MSGTGRTSGGGGGEGTDRADLWEGGRGEETLGERDSADLREAERQWETVAVKWYKYLR